MSGTRKVTRTVTEYRTLNSTYQIDEKAKEWRRVSGVNSALHSQGEDGEWKSYSEAVSAGGVLWVFHDAGQFRTSLIQSSETLALS